MFAILKYEFKYLRFNMMPTLLPPVAMAALLFFGSENIVNGTSYLLALALFGQLIGVRGKEKRSYHEITFPVSRRQLAKVRSMFIYLPVATIYLACVLIHIIFTSAEPNWHYSIYELTMMHGLIILLGHLYYFFTDAFPVFKSSRGKLVFNIITITLLLLLMILLSNAIESSFNNSYFSGIGSKVFLVVAGFVMAFITSYTFMFRESLID